VHAFIGHAGKLAAAAAFRIARGVGVIDATPIPADGNALFAAVTQCFADTTALQVTVSLYQMSPSFKSVTVPPLGYHCQACLIDVTTRKNFGEPHVTIA
jgi:hypothetical protein